MKVAWNDVWVTEKWKDCEQDIKEMWAISNVFTLHNSCTLIITHPKCQTSHCNLKEQLWTERLFLLRQNLDFVRKHHELCESFVRKERNDFEESSSDTAEKSVGLHFNPKITIQMNSWRNGLWEALLYSHPMQPLNTHSVQSTCSNDHNHDSKCYERCGRL